MTKYLQIGTHGVSGVHAWTQMAKGMGSAPSAEKPPHMDMIQKFWCGASAPPYEVSVVHCIEGKENLDNVTALFDLETPFMKGFFEAPVMKGQESTLKWNTFEVMAEHPASEDSWSGVEDGAVIGIYSHGVPDAAQWAEIFAKAVKEEGFHKDSGIIKSYGGKMVGDCAWAPKQGEGAMVIHVFKSLDDKAKFDKMFDPTGEFFGGIIAGGACFEPFYSGALGPIFTM